MERSERLPRWTLHQVWTIQISSLLQLGHVHLLHLVVLTDFRTQKCCRHFDMTSDLTRMAFGQHIVTDHCRHPSQV